VQQAASPTSATLLFVHDGHFYQADFVKYNDVEVSTFFNSSGVFQTRPANRHK
jgi:hypothetical protein